MSDEPEKILTFGELFQRLLRLILPLWKEAALVGVLLLMTLALELAGPLVIAAATNNVTHVVSGSETAKAAVRAVALFGALYLGLSAARSVLMYIGGVEQARLTQNILWSLRRKLYDAMQGMSFSFFDHAHSGQLISRVTTDVQRVARFFDAAFFSSLEALVILGVSALYMFYMSPLLAVVALSTVPVTLIIVIRSAKRIRPLFKAARDSYGDVTTALQENIAGVKVVRAFAKEDAETHKFSGRIADYLRKVFTAVDYWAARMPLAMFLYRLNEPLILVAGGYLVIKGPAAGGIELGTLFAFMLYMHRMSWRIHMIGGIVNSIARASAAGDRIYEILDARPEVAERPKAVGLPEGRGAVVFDNVGFSYDHGKPVLRDIDLKVEPGEFVALVGHTGCGKTTLVNLIPRFYDADTGSVKIDGADVRDITLESLRRNVALIFQETFLFSARVRDNIAYGNPDAGLDDIIQAAKAAQAHEFIEKLEEGYETVIGERGVTLSGGQRQRIAIARALLANPRVLIMDDATASVDSATERMIQEALVELTRNRTTFVIAHRLSTVRRADKIVVLSQGRIAEIGAHKELLDRGGIYRDVYDLQLAEPESPEEIP